jgi:18S rRNA (adenine1779-N6/adenine1780-N6)-dimethyltransferase
MMLCKSRNISFEEFDGMLRFCFNRKNKTLRASWFTKEVLAIVEKNYRIYCAMNDIPIEEGLAEDNGDGDDDMDMDDTGAATAADEDNDEEEWGGIMDVDGNDDDDDMPEFFKEQKQLAKANGSAKTPSRRKKTKMGEIVREKIRKVLEDVTGLADKRASKCDENDFLKLLFAFNEEGIHFA